MKVFSFLLLSQHEEGNLEGRLRITINSFLCRDFEKFGIVIISEKNWDEDFMDILSSVLLVKGSFDIFFPAWKREVLRGI